MKICIILNGEIKTPGVQLPITKEVYMSARMAAEKLGMSHSTLKSMLNGARINKTSCKYEEDRYSNCRN